MFCGFLSLDVFYKEDEVKLEILKFCKFVFMFFIIKDFENIVFYEWLF